MWSNDCLNGLSVCLLIAILLIQMHEQGRNGGVETKMERSDEMKICEICCYFMWEEWTSGFPVCSCWEEREWTIALYRWLIPRDVKIKDSNEDLAGKRQEGCVSPADVALPSFCWKECWATDGHAFRQPWVLFIFSRYYPPLCRSGPIIFWAEISARS